MLCRFQAILISVFLKHFIDGTVVAFDFIYGSASEMKGIGRKIDRLIVFVAVVRSSGGSHLSIILSKCLW